MIQTGPHTLGRATNVVARATFLWPPASWFGPANTNSGVCEPVCKPWTGSKQVVNRFNLQSVWCVNSYTISALPLAHHSPISLPRPLASPPAPGTSQGVKPADQGRWMCAPSNQQMHAKWAGGRPPCLNLCVSMPRCSCILHRAWKVSPQFVKRTLETHLTGAAQSNDGASKCDDINLIALTNHASRSRHRQKVTLHRKKPSKTLRFGHGGRVHGTKGQLDFPDHASVHLEPPGKGKESLMMR